MHFKEEKTSTNPLTMDAVFNSSMAKVSVVPPNTYEDQAKAEHGSAKNRQCQSPDIKSYQDVKKKELN